MPRICPCHCLALTASRLLFASVLGMAMLSGGSARATVGTEIRRFALIAGANDGGRSRVALRYAHSDAGSLAQVLRQLGGVAPRDSLLVLEPDRFDFEAALGRMRGMLEEVRGRGIRVELVFYYSGHSDEQGLMLGDEVVTYRELRTALAELPADVRIAILDSCSSGALTRGKGGTMKAPFLLDSSTDVRGYAYLTSSAADEVAQESDRIGGSFFTYFLVAGLRGAADNTRDGKVTLNEAYQYAFHETLSRTEGSRAGPQHPNYDFQLAGSGDLVLTDLRGTSALLELPSDLAGRVYLRDGRGTLVVELSKPMGSPMRLGLPPGTYELSLDAKTERRRGSISIGSSGTTVVARSQLALASGEDFAWRGKGDVADQDLAPKFDEPRLRHRPFSIGIVPGLTTDSAADSQVLNNASLNFVGWGDALRGFELGYVANIRKLDVVGGQAAGVFNFAASDVVGGQAAGWFNRAGASFMGFQGAGLVNSVGGPARGLQLAGLANADRGSVTGVQLVLGVNLAGGSDSRGMQLAGLSSLGGGSFEGAQIGGLVSATRGPVRGLQLSGLFNAAAQSLAGAQLSTVNFAKQVRGLQLGLLNVAGQVRGIQIGVVNIAAESMSGASFGLVNYAGDGILAPVVWTGDAAVANIGLKMGSRHVYSLIGAGIHPLGKSPSFSLLAGLGGHFDFHPAWLEVDYLFGTVQKDMRWSFDEPLLTHTLRFVFGWRFVDQLSMFAGPTFGLEQSRSGQRTSYLPEISRQVFGDTRLTQTIGFVVGLSLEPRVGKLNSFE